MMGGLKHNCAIEVVVTTQFVSVVGPENPPILSVGQVGGESRSCSAATWPWPGRVKDEVAAGTTVGELSIAVEAANSGSSRAAATAVVQAGG